MDSKACIFTLFVFICVINLCSAKNLARGYNDDIAWVGYKDGLEQAQASGKPILLLVHKTWCGSCKALKPKVATCTEMEELSKQFVMINIEDDEENDLPEKGRDFQPDGGYIPRLMFLDSNGKLNKDLINADGNPKYKHYYSDEHQIVKAMQQALDVMSGSTREKEL